MHMADALLSPMVGGALWAASAGSVAYAAARIQKDGFSEKKLPVMAVAGAFIFAAQMINFTIPGTGSSGHIGGGLLLSGLLGGGPALLTLSAVLVIQCLFFADGGLLALGANIFNIGILPCLVAYPLVFRPLLRKGITKQRLSIASVLSIVLGLQLGAFGVVIETLASGVTELPFRTFMLLMQPIHLAIGLVEGIVTAAILCFVWQIRPELVESTQKRTPVPAGAAMRRIVAVLAVSALLLGGGLSWFASSNPDGLEWSMEHTAGTAELERSDPVHTAATEIQHRLSLLPDYDFASGNGSGTAAAGITGAILTCALAAGIGGAVTLYKRKKTGK